MQGIPGPTEDRVVTAAPADAPADVTGKQAGLHQTAPVGSARLVDELLLIALSGLRDQTPAGGPITVLDCGGGSGRVAVPLASAGATVTVVDLSVDALATLRRRADEAGVADRVIAVQGDVEALADVVAPRCFDLVLAHGILEAVEPLAETFAAIAGAVRPGGLLSVLVGNPVAVVLARVLAGDVAAAERDVLVLDDSAGRPSPSSVRRLCAQHDLSVEQVHGIGVFRDLVPGRALDEPGALEALTRLEAACAQRSPFAEIAARVLLLARRPRGV